MTKRIIPVLCLIFALLACAPNDAFGWGLRCGWFGGASCRQTYSCGGYAIASCSLRYGTCSGGSCAVRQSTTCSGGSCAVRQSTTCSGGSCAARQSTTCSGGSCAVRRQPVKVPGPEPDDEKMALEEQFVAIANRYRRTPLKLSDRFKAACVRNSQYQNRYGVGHYGFNSTYEIATPGASPTQAVSIFSTSGIHWSWLTSSTFTRCSVGRVGDYWTVQLW